MGLLNEIMRMALHSNPQSKKIARAAEEVVATLIAQGVKRVFAVAGESYLALLDAFYDRQSEVQVITCRHEANAANMAEATGKLTQRPGVVMVTRGPGAMHASIALHTAQQDATPMIILVGQIARADVGRNAFQELNYHEVFGSVCKAVLELDPARTGEIMARAFRVAMSGRPGPVMVTLPEDVLELPASGVIWPTQYPVFSALTTAQVDAVVKRINTAQRPLLWIGGSGWNQAGVAALAQLAEHATLAVVNSFRRKDVFNNQHPNYAGELGFVLNTATQAALDESDLQLVIGAAVGDIETGGFTRLDPHKTREQMIHISMQAEDAGRVYPVSMALTGNVNAVAAALADAFLSESPKSSTWLASLKAKAQSALESVSIVGQVNLGDVFKTLRQQLPANAIVTNGAGNYAAWLHRYFEHTEYPTQLAPQSGAMGYGLGAGIAAALEHPDRDVVVVAGDGCFTMAISDLITAASLKNLNILVINNGIYGTIRMHQAARFPNRAIATDLHNPSFTEIAKGCGLKAFRVNETAQFADVWAEAQAQRPALIELVTDRRDIAPGKILEN